MHPFSILTLGIFVAGYITARWDLVTRLYELAIFAWDYGVVVSRHPAPLRALPPAQNVLTRPRLIP
jgi:phosphatidylinositol glycan class Q protein